MSSYSDRNKNAKSRLLNNLIKNICNNNNNIDSNSVSLTDYENWLESNKATLHRSSNEKSWNRYKYMVAYCNYLKNAHIATEPSTERAPKNFDYYLTRKWNLLRTICNKRKIRFNEQRFQGYVTWASNNRHSHRGLSRYTIMERYCDVVEGKGSTAPATTAPSTTAPATTSTAPDTATATAPTYEFPPEDIMRNERRMYLTQLITNVEKAIGRPNKKLAALHLFKYLNATPSLLLYSHGFRAAVINKIRDFENDIAEYRAKYNTANILGSTADLKANVDYVVDKNSPLYMSIKNNISNLMNDLKMYYNSLEHEPLLEAMNETKALLNKHALI